mmetsp:Transcript_26963/g.65497  ORF Transcript_26963/g.65497 Transcript_26963/m.65497 type:complete len:322 (+) Transcript_26963:41-1006(+)
MVEDPSCFLLLTPDDAPVTRLKDEEKPPLDLDFSKDTKRAVNGTMPASPLDYGGGSWDGFFKPPTLSHSGFPKQGDAGTPFGMEMDMFTDLRQPEPQTPEGEDVERLILHQEKKEEKVPLFVKKRANVEQKKPLRSKRHEVRYKGRKYIGPTRRKRPNYKRNQNWEWDIYPHGISKQNGKLRVQIKRKGINPTYPSFPNNLQGLLDAAMFRDGESKRLWEAGILKRAPKFNFESENSKRSKIEPSHSRKASMQRIQRPESPSAVPRKRRKSQRLMQRRSHASGVGETEGTNAFTDDANSGEVIRSNDIMTSFRQFEHLMMV